MASEEVSRDALQLSNPPNDDSTASLPTTTPSLLERLPPELRLRIYDHLFPQKPIPSHAHSRDPLRHAGSQPTTTTILRLNRAIHAEAEAALYSRTVFEVRIRPITGIQLAAGRGLTYAEFDFGKRGGPSRVFPVEEAWARALVRNVRRLRVCVEVGAQRQQQQQQQQDRHQHQRSLFEWTREYVEFLVDRLCGAGAPLCGIWVELDWRNWSVAGQVAQRPDVEIVRGLLQPFEGLRGVRKVGFGDIVPEGLGAGEREVAAAEDEAYRALKEELRRSMMSGWAGMASNAQRA